MSRTSSALIVAVVAALIAAGVPYYIQEQRRLSALEETATTYVGSQEFSAVRARCNVNAAHLGTGPATGPEKDGPPVEFYGYDGEFHPADPSAPAFSLDLAEKMRGKITAVDHYSAAEGTGVEVGVTTPWKISPCALMLVRVPPKPGEVRREQMYALGLGLAVGIVAWLVEKRRLARRKAT